MNTQKLASCIAEYRKKSGMTQREFADHLGVTAKAVSKWETGVNVPDVSLLATIIRTLGIPVEILLEDEPDSEQEFFSSLLLNPAYPKENLMNTNQAFETIQINLDGSGPLSPYVFGHNLEHTRASIHTGLSAQMLRNRKFAGKPAKNDGCPAFWFPVGGKDVFLDLYMAHQEKSYTKHAVSNKMRRWSEIQCLGVQNLFGEKLCGIGQSGIVLTENTSYELRTVTRCDRAVEICVRLQDAAGNEIYAEEKLSLVPGDWQVCEFTLTSGQDVADASVTFAFKEKTRVLFGALSMMPADHFHGMRTDVIAHLKEMGVSVLRWPGGNFAGEYRWQDGLLPVDMRAPLQAYMEMETQTYSNGYDFHEIGTDEFIALCKEIGAEPYITINAVWNTSEENAAWVEYCNGSEETEYGKIRAERGHKEPYNVKFWALGNEMGFGHMEGPKTPEQYVALVRPHAKAMLAVSPDIQLFVSGPYPNANWVEHAAIPLSDQASFVSLHHYEEVYRDYTTPEAIEETCRQLLGKPKGVQEMIREMRGLMGDSAHIAYDEWNCWYAWHRASNVLDGIFAAKMLHMFMYESQTSDVPICCYFQPVGEGAIEVDPTESRLTAIGQVFTMLKEHKGGNLCQMVSMGEFNSAATIKDEILTVTLINTDLYDAKPAVINIEGIVCSAEILESESVLPYTYFTKRDLATTSENGLLKVVLPPHSVAKICVAVV